MGRITAWTRLTGERAPPTRWLYAIVGLMATALVAAEEPARQSAAAADLEQALDCIVEPSVVVDIGAATPGVLSQIPVDRADVVEAGQLVAHLESEVEQAALELAKARAGLSTSVELRQANARFGERQEDRRKELLEKNLLPKEDFDRLQTEAEIARLQAREAEDEKRLASLELQRAQAALARRQMRSPVSGIVLERYKSPGEYVEDQPVLRIANIETLHVEILAPVELFGRIHNGMQARVTLQPEHLGNYTAKVTRVDSVADAASGTFGVRLELPNAEGRIPSGLRCTAQMLERVEEPALAKKTATPSVIKPQPVRQAVTPPAQTRPLQAPAASPVRKTAQVQPAESPVLKAAQAQPVASAVRKTAQVEQAGVTPDPRPNPAAATRQPAVARATSAGVTPKQPAPERQVSMHEPNTANRTGVPAAPRRNTLAWN